MRNKIELPTNLLILPKRAGLVRVVVYPRVSSLTQKEARSILIQLAKAPEYIEQRSGDGWQLVAPVDYYSDDGKSAYKNLENRDGIKRLLADAAAGRFDLVLVYDLDRLTRDPDLIDRYAVIGGLQRARVLLADMKGAVHDLNTMNGDLMVSLASVQSADYSRKLSGRVLDGFARKLAEGVPVRQLPLGFAYDRKARAFMHTDMAKIVVEIFERVRKGESYGSIGADLNARKIAPGPRTKQGWAPERIYKLLNCTAYRGELLAWKKPRTILKVPPIISPADWYATHAANAQRMTPGRRWDRRSDRTVLARGLGRCTECGLGIVTAYGKPKKGIDAPALGGVLVYTCSGRYRHGICTLPRWRQPDVDALIWEEVRGFVKSPGKYEREIREARERTRKAMAGKDWAGEVAKIEKAIARLGEKENAIMAQFQKDKISAKAMEVATDSIAHERAELSTALENAKAQAAAIDAQLGATSGARATDVLAQIRKRIDKATGAERVEIVRAIVTRIDFSPDGDTVIHYNPTPGEHVPGPAPRPLPRETPTGRNRRPRLTDVVTTAGTRSGSGVGSVHPTAHVQL